MARHLAGDGHHCLVPSLKPSDGRDGLPAMARQLQDFLEGELEEGERFALVGFSMGTLITRYYLQELDGHRRVKAFFSISGPLGNAHIGCLRSHLCARLVFLRI